MSKRVGLKKLAYTALFTALIVAGGFVRFPIGAVPITLQTLFVLLAGSLCGKRVGALSSLIYVALGLIGIPVFSAGGGFAYVLYPTFGYLVGFIFGGLIAGIPKKGFIKRVVFNLLAVLVIHLIGVTYFYLTSNLYLQIADVMYTYVGNIPNHFGGEVSLWQAILTGSLIFLPIDILSAILSAFIANKVSPIINK